MESCYYKHAFNMMIMYSFFNRYYHPRNHDTAHGDDTSTIASPSPVPDLLSPAPESPRHSPEPEPVEDSLKPELPSFVVEDSLKPELPSLVVEDSPEPESVGEQDIVTIVTSKQATSGPPPLLFGKIVNKLLMNKRVQVAAIFKHNSPLGRVASDVCSRVSLTL